MTRWSSWDNSACSLNPCPSPEPEGQTLSVFAGGCQLLSAVRDWACPHMEILRTTAPRPDELTGGVSQRRLSTVMDYGWSVNDQLAHLRACHDTLGGNMLQIVREDHPVWKVSGVSLFGAGVGLDVWVEGRRRTARRRGISNLLHRLQFAELRYRFSYWGPLRR